METGWMHPIFLIIENASFLHFGDIQQRKPFLPYLQFSRFPSITKLNSIADTVSGSS